MDIEKRASIPPCIPNPNPTISYWQESPSSLANHRTTSDLPTDTDVVIIGSGITGALLAYYLLERPSPPRVLLFEARTVCSGATGRNGGHTKHAEYREFSDNKRNLGEEEAAKIARFKFNCMRAIHDFAREHRIQCDSWQGDTVDVFHDQGQFEKAKKAVSEIKRVLGDTDPAANYRIWNATETREKFLVEDSYGAITYEAGSLWPYKFVVGVLELAIQKGLNLQTCTPVMKLTRVDGRDEWVVQTPRRKVRATKVLLATNGYTAGICPALQGTIVPLRGHMTAQRPGSNLPKAGLSTTYSFIYDDGYEYMISRPAGTKFAGDIMIGGGATKTADKGICEFGTTDDSTVDPVIFDYLKDSAAMRFGSSWGEDNSNGRIRNVWTGIMGYSADGFPLVGDVPEHPNLYISASFQGSGMVLCLDSAKALISIIYKDDDSKLDQWFPRAFHVTSVRTRHRFQGRLHTTAAPMDLETKSRI